MRLDIFIPKYNSALLNMKKGKQIEAQLMTIEKKDIWVTIFKRPIENLIKKQYKKKLEE